MTLEQLLIDSIGQDLFDVYEAAFNGSWIWDLDADGDSWVSPAFGRTFGYEPEEVPQGARFWHAIANPEDWEPAIKAAGDESGIYDATIRYRHRNGQWVTVRNVGRIKGGYGFGFQIDVTAQAKLQEQLEELSRRDELTGLWNRRGMEEAIPKALSIADRHRLQVYAAMIDVDDFKLVNSGYGQAAGDAALQAIGRRIEENLRLTDDCARIGGDEFMALVCCRGPKEARTVMQRLRTEVSKPISLGDGDVAQVTCSMALVRLTLAQDGRCATLAEAIQKASPLLIEAKGASNKDTVVGTASIFPAAV